MLFRRDTLVESPALHALPVRTICVGHGARQIAVHVRGDLASARLPIVCLPGFHRNMLDFSGFLQRAETLGAGAGPFVLIDLAGRGRSARLPKDGYSTLVDADDVLAVIDALGIGRAVFLGEGHGGHVIMALSARRPMVIGGAILLDSGPVADPRGLVRARNNLRYIESLGEERHCRMALRKMLLANYPGETEARLDMLAARIVQYTRRGRVRPLYDPKLLARLDAFDVDDVLEPQWPLYDTLNHAPLMLIRTQLSDQLRRETFDEMARRRGDALTQVIEGQGSPALLEGPDEVGGILDFARHAMKHARTAA